MKQVVINCPLCGGKVRTETKEALKKILLQFFEQPKSMSDFRDFLGTVYGEMIDNEGSLERYHQCQVVATKSEKK